MFRKDGTNQPLQAGFKICYRRDHETLVITDGRHDVLLWRIKRQDDKYLVQGLSDEQVAAVVRAIAQSHCLDVSPPTANGDTVIYTVVEPK